MIIILLLVGLLAMWIWSLVKMPSKRAREIFDAKGAIPSGVTDRDRAYVLDLHNRFGTQDFYLKAIENRNLDASVAERFDVRSGRLDDRTVLGVRLPYLNLLVSYEPGRYRLTEEAARLAGTLASTNESRENIHHG